MLESLHSWPSMARTLVVGVAAVKFFDADPRRKALSLMVSGANRVTFGPNQNGAVDNLDGISVVAANGIVDIVGQFAGREIWAVASAAGTQASVVGYLDPGYNQDTYH